MSACPALQAARRAEGVCPLDGRPVKPGRARCVQCCARNVAQLRRARGRRIKAGLCQDNCGAPRVAGERRCVECKAVNQIKCAARYAADKAAGLCADRCGQLATHGRKCETCAAARRERRAEP